MCICSCIYSGNVLRGVVGYEETASSSAQNTWCPVSRTNTFVCGAINVDAKLGSGGSVLGQSKRHNGTSACGETDLLLRIKQSRRGHEQLLDHLFASTPQPLSRTADGHLCSSNCILTAVTSVHHIYRSSLRLKFSERDIAFIFLLSPIKFIRYCESILFFYSTSLHFTNVR